MFQFTSKIHFVPKLLITAFLLAGSACAAPGPDESKAQILRYECTSGAAFQIELRPETATVTIGNRSYRLQRRPTSFTRKYAAEVGTFIQDGDQAVLSFVNDRRYLDCRRAKPVEPGA